MKKYYLKKIYETIKFIFTNLIICGIIIGVITGLIVTFLFYTPEISLIDTSVRITDDKAYFDFTYENKGQTPAINIEYMFRYVVLYKNEIINHDRQQEKYAKQEVGDIVTNSLILDNTKLEKQEKDKFKNSELIILAKIKYEDSSKIRYFINKRILNNQYIVYRLAFYDVSKQGKALSPLKPERRNEFKHMIDIWIEE